MGTPADDIYREYILSARVGGLRAGGREGSAAGRQPAAVSIWAVSIW
jgi:hypothetical protein